ncbi:hypothetical protein V6R21_02245 [Limibacter armeniacum]|uniref:hypothetical protein n=1 Tax=Limibacter armeniacum TaxID=466084 RepID=UPI002FE5753D
MNKQYILVSGLLLLLTVSLSGVKGTGKNSPCQADYREVNKMVIMDAASLPDTGGWVMKQSGNDYTGKGFMEWEGDNCFRQPQGGMLTVSFQITTGGRYCFIWRNRVGEGDNPTEANDSWVRFPDASAYYGELKGQKKYPKGLDKQPYTNGVSVDGWMKVFHHNKHLDWTWHTRTSDHEGMELFAEFDQPGQYTLQIAGRSRHHQIDRIVLYHTSVEKGVATDSATAETRCQ